ncbi:MAG: phosphopantetheine-binding protein [Planctomycetota bacterium]
MSISTDHQGDKVAVMKPHPQNVATLLQKILRRHILNSKAQDDSLMAHNLNEMGLDSISAIDLLLEIESEFGITIPDDKLTEETFKTGNSLAATIIGVIEAS